MLDYLKVRNFRSIVEATVDLRYAEKRAPSGYKGLERMPFIAEGRDRAVPILALFGANAAGKSNLIRALATLRTILASGSGDVRSLAEVNQIVPSGAFSEVEVGFTQADDSYCYRLAFGSSGVRSELLMCNGKIVFSAGVVRVNLRHLVSKAYPTHKLLEIIRVECCAADDGQKMVVPLLRVIGRGYANLNPFVARAYEFFTTKLLVLVRRSMIEMFPMAVQTLQQAGGYSQDEALKRIVSVVRRLDIDVESIRIAENPNGAASGFAGSDYLAGNAQTKEPVGLIVQSRHTNVAGEDVFFRFMEQESEGTKRLASLVGYLLAALERGCVAVVDEFDTALHPMLVDEILSLFYNRSRNEKGAQLVFATHMTDILDGNLLRVGEIGFVQKHRKLGTLVRRLLDVKDCGADIRNATNFRRQYLDGKYSAIPHPAV